jgi:hypothetical protein
MAFDYFVFDRVIHRRHQSANNVLTHRQIYHARQVARKETYTGHVRLHKWHCAISLAKLLEAPRA